MENGLSPPILKFLELSPPTLDSDRQSQNPKKNYIIFIIILNNINKIYYNLYYYFII